MPAVRSDGRAGWSGWVVGLDGRVGWLDNWEIMLNSVQLSWKLTEIGKIPDHCILVEKEIDTVFPQGFYI